MMLGPEQRRFLPRIKSMRGIAALTVALMHVTSSWVDTPARGAFDVIGLKAIKALSNGYGAVVAFFVISGFVLARSLDRDLDVLRFVRARSLRLFPAAITTIAIFAVAFYVFGFNLYEGASFTPLNIVANMLMLHVDIDRVMWSMKAELAATPLIFFCVWLFRRYGESSVIAIASVLFGLSFVGQYGHAIGTDTNLAPLYAFPVGILLHFRGAAFAERLELRTVTLAALISIGIFCACSFFKPEGTLPLLVGCMSAAILVGLIAYRPDAPLFVPLDLPIVRFYGRDLLQFLSSASALVLGVGAGDRRLVEAVWLASDGSDSPDQLRLFHRRDHAAGLSFMAVCRAGGAPLAATAWRGASFLRCSGCAITRRAFALTAPVGAIRSRAKPISTACSRSLQRCVRSKARAGQA